MSSKDSDYIAHRFVDVESDEAEPGTMPWYKRTDLSKESPTECLLCREAENEMYTKYAHPKAHLEAHKVANMFAEETIAKQVGLSEKFT